MHESDLQFVLLRHSRAGDVHWDLGLEANEVLATWQILENPEIMAISTRALTARRIGDHRKVYLDYEGPISRGRGNVVRVDRGSWQPVNQEADCRRIRLGGQVLKGTFTLRRSPDGTDAWTIRREPGEGENAD